MTSCRAVKEKPIKKTITIVFYGFRQCYTKTAAVLCRCLVARLENRQVSICFF